MSGSHLCKKEPFWHFLNQHCARVRQTANDGRRSPYASPFQQAQSFCGGGAIQEPQRDPEFTIQQMDNDKCGELLEEFHIVGCWIKQGTLQQSIWFPTFFISEIKCVCDLQIDARLLLSVLALIQFETSYIRITFTSKSKCVVKMCEKPYNYCCTTIFYGRKYIYF